MLSLVGTAVIKDQSTLTGQLICNGHAITKLGITESTQESLTESTPPECRNGEVVSQEQVRIATAIFPSASMMNHSCDPNIINR